MKKEVTIYTDGACSGNPGPGGWAAILKYKDLERELSGGEALTTNNRMELMSVVESLSLLREPCAVKIVSDSKYVVDSVNKGWVRAWQRNGWRNSKKITPPNCDLWQKLLQLLERHEVSFCWIRGHAGHPYNERCDRLAVEQSKRFSSRGR